ncbi:MAG: hypothetical protein COY75_02980 [Nitrospirae bacterium CG_4_10_14_0_8_um_filter_41_23]|nr:MAG: hypothetical protein AUK38_02100 [Nitrospirae bacterium CG2_30_41_42]PIQ93110.1 MAG: hypothetical protein COV68_11730 [Nitrospirae bacterium CG11_big_fil_rev_8_21_14_0_20_41_14]PIV42011.1 MAG: hypothetical protein COS27_08300 [Nitrospirae bacterium CG02_land_8_20_14_3_00_41_53]PIW86872.1 MAG: hypothetical protein COZ94_08280 [Nitrospirae bacterium CG_4_8_14_3_um_filter_41_47]PIY87412.1 MAG: hypothetical protein COY75_02980 [Nitrospirae bacterium CG_4_10_14_0_8_um_filter_41_23]PJA80421.
MKVKLSRHAKNRNRKIQATVFEIIECIENPDSHYIQDNGREVTIKAAGNKLLKIVYRRSIERYEIVTIINRNQ